MLPLDLHVLSLPLAFILSQDQTLHCKNLFLNLFTKTNPVNSIQNTNKLIFWRDFHISPGCLLHNFKELYFAFGTTKLRFLYSLPNKKWDIFSGLSLSQLPFLPKAGRLSLLPFNQLLVLKRVQMYEMNFTIQIYMQIFCNNIFIFFHSICICLWFKSLIGGRFEEDFELKHTFIYSI